MKIWDEAVSIANKEAKAMQKKDSFLKDVDILFQLTQYYIINYRRGLKIRADSLYTYLLNFTHKKY